MKYSTRILLLIIVTGILTSACNNDKTYLTLTKSKIEKEYEIDTLESYPKRGIYLVGVTINHALGKFDYYLAVIKKTNAERIIYKIQEHTNGTRISKDYVALVESYGETNWGWFNINAGKIQHELPRINIIIDSLKSTNSKDLFISETNGYISFRLKGKLIKSFNYGDFATKYKSQNFDSLEYKLYQLKGDSLIVASNEGNDLFKQKDGVYFIPNPGYGVISKFNKQEILNAVDSISKLSLTPGILMIKAVQ